MVDLLIVFVGLPLLVIVIRLLLRHYLGEEALESGGGIHLSTKLAFAALVLIYMIIFVIPLIISDAD